MLCENLEGWDRVEAGEKFKREWTYVNLWPIYIVRWNPTQHSKVIIFQSKRKNDSI